MGANASNTADKAQYMGSTMQYYYSHADLIGRGMFGAVYKAKVTKRGDYEGRDVVAVKVMQIFAAYKTVPGQGGFMEAEEKLKKLLKLSHENLVTYHKVSIIKATGGATVELAMDYHEGDLASFLMEAKQNQNLLNSYNKVAQLVACIARGLEFLHENNIIHGDLKPGNILVAVAEGGRRKLLISDLDDFVQMQGNVTCSADISQMRGTKRYMSPEMLKKFSQAETDSPGRKTDIWSLGCIILEMDQISSGVLEIQLVKDGNVVNAGDNLSNDQYAIKIMDGYMPVVGGGNAPNSADLIRKCLDPVAANRISSKELLHELRNKQVIVLFPCDCEIDYAFFIILFDPATGSLNPKKVVRKPTTFGQLRAPSRQLTETDILFADAVFDPTDNFLRLHLWNVGEETWREQKCILPLLLHLPLGLVVLGRICYFWDNYSKQFTEMDIYSGSTKSLTNPPVEINIHSEFLKSSTSPATWGELIYYAATDRVHQYDTVADKWETLPKFPQRRKAFAVAVVNGYVYVIGGYLPDDSDERIIKSADCIRQNVDTGKWEAIEPLGHPRYRHAACVIHDRIYVCGGRDDLNKCALSIEVYDTKQGAGWSIVNLHQKDTRFLSDLAEECSSLFGDLTAKTIRLISDAVPGSSN